MRTWLLLALVGFVVLYVYISREGVDSTLSPAPTCPNNGTLYGNLCRDEMGSTSGPTCPSGYSFTPGTLGSGRCVNLSTESLDSATIVACNKYWDGAIASWALGQKAAAFEQKCMPYAPSWITPDMLDKLPTPATTAQAVIEKGQADANKSRGAAGRVYASSTGYADLLAAAQGEDLPPPIDATARPTDVGATRPLDGPVFGPNGVFSGEAGTGQNTASSAAAGLTGGSQYGGTPGGNYDSTGNEPGSGAYGMWQGTGGTPPPPPGGNNLPVNGPSWGGKGVSGVTKSSTSSRPAPTLYGPNSGNSGPGSGIQSGYPQLNSMSTVGLPSFGSAGSEPNNNFAVTSRCPGDQDLIPNPYLQSSAYSLANGSQKTNPVPFLSDFSAFQR